MTRARSRAQTHRVKARRVTPVSTFPSTLCQAATARIKGSELNSLLVSEAVADNILKRCLTAPLHCLAAWVTGLFLRLPLISDVASSSEAKQEPKIVKFGPILSDLTPPPTSRRQILI